MAATGAYAADVLARLRDYFSPRAHWQRRLWNAGLVLELRETVEASEGVRNRALSQEALAWLADRVRGHVALDPGAGDRAQRTALMECLKRDLIVDGISYLKLKHLVAEIGERYLERWATELRTQPQLPGRERTARALAAHLLDAGFGLDNLSTWLENLAEATAPASTSLISSKPPRALWPLRLCTTRSWFHSR